MEARRRLVRTFAATLALALAAGAAEARSYYIVQSGPDAWTVMDPEGIERLSDAVRKAWVVRVQRNILTGDPPTPGYVRTLNEYDCEASRTRWREFSAFSRSGAAASPATASAIRQAVALVMDSLPIHPAPA